MSNPSDNERDNKLNSPRNNNGVVDRARRSADTALSPAGQHLATTTRGHGARLGVAVLILITLAALTWRVFGSGVSPPLSVAPATVASQTPAQTPTMPLVWVLAHTLTPLTITCEPVPGGTAVDTGCNGAAGLDAALDHFGFTALLMDEGLAHEVQEANTVGSWTIVVKQVFAGDDTVVIGYILRGPLVQAQIEPQTPNLVDDQGLDYPWRARHFEPGGYSEREQGFVQGEVALFTLPEAVRTRPELKLRFTVPGLTVVQAFASGAAETMPQQPFVVELSIPVTSLTPTATPPPPPTWPPPVPTKPFKLPAPLPSNIATSAPTATLLPTALAGQSAPLQITNMRQLQPVEAFYAGGSNMPGAGPETNGFPLWSPAGDKFLVLARGEELTVIDTGAGLVTTVTAHVAGFGWSADSKYIIYKEQGSASFRRRVFATADEGKTRTQLGFSNNSECMPVINQAGSWCAEAGALLLAPLDGSPAQRVGPPLKCQQPGALALTTASTRVAYSCGHGEFYVADLAGGQTAKRQDSDRNLSWSPDGLSLAGLIPSISAGLKGSYLLVQDYAGGRARSIAIDESQGGVHNAQWLPDSRHLLVSASDERGWRIILADAVSGQAWDISPPGWQGRFALASDGKKLLLSNEDDQSFTHFWLADLLPGK